MQTLQNPQEVKSLIEQIKRRKFEIENSKTIQELIADSFRERWERFEKNKTEKFQRVIQFNQTSLKVEISIIESLRQLVDDEFLQNLEHGFSLIRKTKDLRSIKSVYSKYQHDEKLRQVLKLITCIYKYNTETDKQYLYLIKQTLKSRIKYATLCPHCGEIAKKILTNIQNTKVLQLP